MSPLITAVSPTSDPKNTAVTITGNNFGTDAGKVTVSFNAAPATVQSVTNTQIVALVPLKANTGIVKVTVNTQSVDGPIFNYVASYIMSTIAGNGTRGHVDGAAASAQFDNPACLAVDALGNIFVADGNSIRKITAGANPVVSTFAGSPTSVSGSDDGAGNSARFALPVGLAMDAQGNLIVGDLGYSLIRKVTPAAVVTTLLGKKGGGSGYTDGILDVAQVNSPSGIAFDAQGDILVADGNNACIRKISTTGIVSTLAGNGAVAGGYTDASGTAARFRSPFRLAVDAAGNIYVTDTDNHVIRKVTAAGVVTTYGAGPGIVDGDISVARFFTPYGFAIDSSGNMYVIDRHINAANITTDYTRKITPAGMVSTIAGSDVGYADGDGLTAKFNRLFGIATDAQGNIYVSDGTNYRIRKIAKE